MPTPTHAAWTRRLLAGGAQLVVVLPPREYAADHLPGARTIPLTALDQQTAAPLHPDQPVIVSCHDTQ